MANAKGVYSTSFNITSFQGLNQSGDGYNMDMRYAREMENVSVRGGSFQPMREGYRIEQELTNPIGTLAYLARRYGQDTTTLMVAVSNGEVFTKVLDGDDDWVKRYPAEGGEPLANSDCDWLTYEVNERGGTALPAPVDVLLFTNATDGMFCLYGDTLDVVPVTIIPDPENAPNAQVKFGVIARYNERIWGSGIDGEPDKLMYSAPYNPFDWEQNEDIPEDGAGDILQPTWDGDYFVALRQLGSSLLAIKRNSVWRIYGTDPGTFTMALQYGGGTIEENTVATYNDVAFMLGEKGLFRYDGSGAFPFAQDAIKDLMHDHVNKAALDKACAGMWNGTYCLALPLNGSSYCNAILQYNADERMFSLRTEISVDGFLQINERLFYTSATHPGVVYELNDSTGTTKVSRWISGYQDLGVKSSIKSCFIVYMMVDSEAPVELRVGIRTEKKLKQKTLNTRPGKMTRIQLNLQGRIFRLEIHSYSAVPFTISGGVKVDLELDPD